MKWPTHADYQETIQNPSFCLKDPELKSATVACNMLGLPKVMSGNFASVYELSHNDVRWAVRCFVRQVPNQHKHYALLSQHLGSIRPECLVGFEYILEGIQLHGRWYPIVKMDWVKGDPLNVFLEDYHEDPDLLLNMAQSFRELVNSLIIHQIAHGDLQHGNIMVTPDKELKLVDYDGMYVPPLGQIQSPELGHANYQHPKRTPHFYNSTLDRFSALVVYTSLRALAADAGLWSTFYCGENLLFTAEDFKNPDDSNVFKALLNSPDPSVSKLTQLLRRSCLGNITEVAEFELMVNAALSSSPLPESLLRTPEPAKAPIDRSSVWWDEGNSEQDNQEQPENETANQNLSPRTGDTGIVVRDWTQPAPLADESSADNENNETDIPDESEAREDESETSPILWVALSLAAAGISFIPGLHLIVGVIGILIGIFSWSKIPKSILTHRAMIGAAIALSCLMVVYGGLLLSSKTSENQSSQTSEATNDDDEDRDSNEAEKSVKPDRDTASTMESSAAASSEEQTKPNTSLGAPAEFSLTETIASGVGEIWSIRLSTKEERIALGGDSGEVVVWTWPGRELQHTFSAHEDGVVDLAFTPDERLLVTAGKDKKVRFWNLRTGSMEKEHIDYDWAFFPTRLAADARLMVTSAQTRSKANIFEPTSKFLIREIPKHSSWISTLELSQNAEWIITISGDDSIRAIKTKTGDIEQLWIGDRREEAVAIAPDATHVVFGNSDHQLEARSLRTGQLMRKYSRHLAPIKLARFSPKGRFLASAGKDQVIRIWDLNLNQSGQTLSGNAGELLALEFTLDEQSLIAGGQDGKLRVWEMKR